MDVSIVEEISAVQYDNPKIPNVWKVNGSVSCDVHTLLQGKDVSTYVQYHMIISLCVGGSRGSS